MITDLFVCPHCKERLLAEGKSYFCPARHTFDIAKQGYVNLLTGHATSGDHGDNKQMIAARRSFLGAGYYAPLQSALASLAVRYAQNGANVLDAGCGECTYTDGIESALHDTRVGCQVLGVDISKEALILGARKNPRLALAVGTLYHLPLPDESIDLLFDVFAPFCADEYTRVLKKGAIMVMVIPGARHLFGLKRVLYDTPYENEVADTALPRFTLLEDIRIEEEITVRTVEDLLNLLTMTPYFYRTDPAAKAALGTHAPLQTEISFHVLVYRRD